MNNKCNHQDSNGVVCNKKMTDDELNQDGMCSFCADNIWEEIKSGNHTWSHTNNKGDL